MVKLGGNDARVVEYQQIAGRQQRRKIADLPVGQLCARSFHDKHARRITRTRRAQRYPLVRKIEIEGIYSHRAPLVRRDAIGKRSRYSSLPETALFSMSAVISAPGAGADVAGGALFWLASDA